MRGTQVVPDGDLAALHGAETKAFDQAARRDVKRSPERFRLQLTREGAGASRSRIHAAASHDRPLILDGTEGRSVGASLKDAGRKGFAISRIGDAAPVRGILARPAEP